MRKEEIFIIVFTVLFFASCNNTLQCERHYLPKGFIGKVTIYYNQNDGQNETDKNGCIIYKISEKGECYSVFPLKPGFAYPNKTFKYFEVYGKDSLQDLQEFEKYDYLSDSITKMNRKYVFFISSGYHNPDGNHPNYEVEYAVDYGKNHEKYIPH